MASSSTRLAVILLLLAASAATPQAVDFAARKAELAAHADQSQQPADRSALVQFIFPQEPDEAIRLAAEYGLLVDAAPLAAQYLQKPDARSTPLGRSLFDLQKDTDDALFQFVFGDTLRGNAEFAELSKAALTRASQAEPQQRCGIEAITPPAQPRVLAAGRAKGEVKFYVLIGCSGRAVATEWIAGPAALQSAAKREIAKLDDGVQTAPQLVTVTVRL